MHLKYIFGRPGSGKTTKCLQEIAAAQEQNQSHSLIYLVPEQFSLQSEKLLLETGAQACTQVQVLSFGRLAYRIFSAFGMPAGKIADDLGKQMLLRKVLFEVAGELNYYKNALDKHGFVDSLATTITEFNQYRVTSEDLLVRAEGSGKSLKAKLTDLSVILRKYRETVDGKYLLADDMLELLCRRLDSDEGFGEHVPLLDGAIFWVDGFSGFTPQERQVLLYLMRRAKQLTITLTTRDRKDFTDSLCDSPRETFAALVKLAGDYRIEINPHIYMHEHFRHAQSAGLKHFVDNFMLQTLPPVSQLTNKISGRHISAKIIPLDSDNPNIEIISTDDRYAAVYAAAAKIMDWVNREKYTFSDIAILCADRKSYEKILQTTFSRMHIPLFVDTEIDILCHPLTEFIRSALDIFVRNWSYESVFRFLKSGIFGRYIMIDMVDHLENYVLAHGIASYRWQYPFLDPFAEEARGLLLVALQPLIAAKTTATIEQYSRCIFDILYALNIPETLQHWFDTEMTAGNPAVARIHKQIWPKICEVFDKLVEILGEEKVTLKTFAAVLDAGFAQVGLGRIPPTTNQIILGDTARSRYPQIKAMLVLGANEGLMPPTPTQVGLFTDYERKILRDNTGLSLEIAPENLHRIKSNDYELFCVLSQPSERLIFFYPEVEPNGRPLRPAHVLKKIAALFTNLHTVHAPKMQEYHPMLSMAQPDAVLSKSSTDRIYNGIIEIPATRLESFARCKFAYFLTHLLGARPRKEYQVLPSDLGNLFHDVIAQFSLQYWKGQVKSDFTKREIAQIVDRMVNELTLDHHLYQVTARSKHILNKVKNVSTASIWALCHQLQQGQFVPTLIEESIRLDQGEISPNDARRLILTGRVDRVDMLCTADGQEYVKIIDYKSGSTKFSMDELRQGVQLQLMLYLTALTKNRKHALPGGVYYFPIGDPILDTDTELPDKIREASLLKSFKMSGIALADEANLNGLDTSLSAGIASSIIPVRLNRDGSFRKSDTPTVLDLAAFKALGEVVESKVSQLAHSMVQGEIDANPYTTGLKTPCRFCEYHAICGK